MYLSLLYVQKECSPSVQLIKTHIGVSLSNTVLPSTQFALDYIPQRDFYILF